MTASVPEPGTGLPVGPEVDTAPARLPDRDTVLEGRIVRLVALDPAAHAASLYRETCGPDRADLWTYLSSAPFTDEASFRLYLERSAASRDPLFLAIVDRASGEAIGHATYMRIDPAQRVIEVGNILYGRSLQRSPAATEAMYLMARHAFEQLGYRRYEWKCNSLNAPSRLAAARLGFTYEGEFRNHMIVKGRSRDTAWFSMLEEEWPDLRRSFVLWLDPANFDDAGQQRLSLSTLQASWIGGQVVRRADPYDRDAFAELQRAAYAWNRRELGVEPLPLLTSTAEIFQSYEVWLLEENGSELAGALVLEPHYDHLLIWSVSVSPARQNAGIGRLLLGAAEARARALGLGTIRLYTGEKLTKNVEWYGRRGYAVERVEQLGDRRVVHMVKTIKT